MNWAVFGVSRGLETFGRSWTGLLRTDFVHLLMLSDKARLDGGSMECLHAMRVSCPLLAIVIGSKLKYAVEYLFRKYPSLSQPGDGSPGPT